MLKFSREAQKENRGFISSSFKGGQLVCQLGPPSHSKGNAFANFRCVGADGGILNASMPYKGRPTDTWTVGKYYFLNLTKTPSGKFKISPEIIAMDFSETTDASSSGKSRKPSATKSGASRKSTATRKKKPTKPMRVASSTAPKRGGFEPFEPPEDRHVFRAIEKERVRMAKEMADLAKQSVELAEKMAKLAKQMSKLNERYSAVPSKR
jgi:hypothetical protein